MEASKQQTPSNSNLSLQGGATFINILNIMLFYLNILFFFPQQSDYVLFTSIVDLSSFSPFFIQITLLRLHSTMQIYQHQYHHSHHPYEVFFKGNVLVFPNVTKEHRGTYYCVATNVVSSMIMYTMMMTMIMAMMMTMTMWSVL